MKQRRSHKKSNTVEELALDGNGFWNRRTTLALGQQSCVFCHGLGLRPGRAGATAPCNCVFRAIFREVYGRFQYSLNREKHINRVSLESNPGGKTRSAGRFQHEEFVADFCLVTRRTLDEEEYKLFKFHFLLGADWKLCCRQLNLDRGEFFHEVYRIQQRLGRVFAELRPFGLWPVRDYFSSDHRHKRKLTPKEEAELALASAAPKPKPLLQFPLRRKSEKAMAA